MSAQLEQWRVSTVEGVFETDLETLRQWITEGSVAATDKVRKGNLNWIDAGRAPMLKAAFQGESVTTGLRCQSLPYLPTRPGKKGQNHRTDRLVTTTLLRRSATLKIRRPFPPVVT